LKVSLGKDFALRGVLRCHWGLYLNGAPSRGRNGTYYNYYKCKIAGHGNLDAGKAHQQMLEIMKIMSLPEQMIKKVRDESSVIFGAAAGSK
jgi:site-specific DNA recombinase